MTMPVKTLPMPCGVVHSPLLLLLSFQSRRPEKSAVLDNAICCFCWVFHLVDLKKVLWLSMRLIVLMLSKSKPTNQNETNQPNRNQQNTEINRTSKSTKPETEITNQNEINTEVNRTPKPTKPNTEINQTGNRNNQPERNQHRSQQNTETNQTEHRNQPNRKPK